MGLSTTGQTILIIAAAGSFVLAFLLNLPAMPTWIRVGLVFAGPVVAITALAVRQPERGWERFAWVFIAGWAVGAWFAGAAGGYVLSRFVKRS
jgi:hypothetical protein